MTTSTSQTKTAGADAAKTAPKLTAEEASKDKFFADLASIGNQMIAKHGADFAMGAFILAARFIAEGKGLTQKPQKTESCGPGCSGDHHHHDHQHKRRKS